MEYGPDGYPKMPEGRETKENLTAYQRFTDHCRREYCVTDPAEVKKLWDADKIKLAAKAAASHAKALATQARIRAAELAKTRKRK